MSCDNFPDNKNHEKNPAIQLFGKRFFLDQTPTEFLVEFLLVVCSKKRIGSEFFNTALPSMNRLKLWVSEDLEYAPKSRLNLKLFSFLGASRIDTRHVTHREHHNDLIKELIDRITMSSPGSKEEVVRTLENLFIGFQGAGSGRTWCAQSFLPISHGFLTGETIWRESKARKDNPGSWEEVTENLSTYFAKGQHLFLARGGEVLYLQLCNALRQPSEIVRKWVKENRVVLNENEQSPNWVHYQLENELKELEKRYPVTKTLNEIAEFIDSGIECQTAMKTDGDERNLDYVKAGWCSAASWQEGYLFAIELLRLCKASLDIVDRLSLMEFSCIMQVLRSLAMQSSRFISSEYFKNYPGYLMAVTAPWEKRSAVKRISHHTAKAMEKLVFQAIRSDGVELPQGEKEPEKSLKEADRRYAGKLFIGLAKRIGLIVPRRGAGARFVLNEQLLRLLVLTTVPIGGRLTFETFKKLIEVRHGLVFDADGFSRASEWVDGTGVYLPTDLDSWLQEMLEAAGLLIHLSDSCALVENQAGSSS